MGIMNSCVKKHDDDDDRTGDLTNKKNKKIKLFRRICKLCRRKNHCKGKVMPVTQKFLTESITKVPDSIAIDERVIAEAEMVNNLVSDFTVTSNAPGLTINEEHVITETENNLTYNFPATLYELCVNVIKVHIVEETYSTSIEYLTGTTYESPVTLLNNFSTKEKIPITYLWINLDPGGKIIGPPPHFLYQAKYRDTYGYGKGKTKKLGKRYAAADLLKLLNL